MSRKFTQKLCAVCKKKAVKHGAETCGLDCGYVLRSKRVDASRTGAGKILTESDVIKGNDRILLLPRTRIKTLKQLVEVCEIDTKEWEITDFWCNKWEVAAKYDTGMVVEPLFQVKAKMQRRVALLAVRDAIRELVVVAKRDIPRAPAIIRPRLGDYCLEVDIFDHHFGKLAWSPETGWENYDSRIAESLFDQAVTHILDAAKGYRVGQILFPIGNDSLNADNKIGSTTGGTPQSNDSRYHKTFLIQQAAHIRAIRRMREVAPVRVVTVPGNHDELSAWHLGNALDLFFHRDKSVVVDNSPTYRKHYLHGGVLVVWSHGDKEKMTDWGGIISSEYRKMLNGCTWVEVHTGHKHKTASDEKNGIIFRTLASLGPPDGWHAGMGYVGNQRTATGFVFSKEGLAGTVVYRAPQEERDVA
jgi:hypothetical protein